MDRMGQPRPCSYRQGCLKLLFERSSALTRGFMPNSLDTIVADLSGCDRQERIDLLLDFAKALPPLPDRLVAHKDASHRVEECQSPVYLFVEFNGDRISLHADAPIEAPTVRGFVSLLLEGLNGATVEEVLQVPGNLVERCGLGEILGMLRVRGLTGVLRRLKAEVTRAAIDRTRSTTDNTSSAPVPG
jgi:cysteine desulfuration protein SufE